MFSKNQAYIMVILTLLFLPSVAQTANNNIYSGQINPVGFIENKGQIIDLENKPNPSVLFLYNSQGLNIQLRQTGFSYDVYSIESKTKNKSDLIKQDEQEVVYHFHRVDIELVGCNLNAQIEAKKKSADYANYYTTGTSKEGVLNIHNFGEVYYHNIYNKIDLQFLVIDGKPKYNFILHRGANIADIKLQFNGANQTKLTENADIEITTSQGTVLEKLPLSYYKETNEKVSLSIYQIGENVFGISGEHNKNSTIVIDPTPLLVWSIKFPLSGGSSISTDVSTDNNNNIFLTGSTNSTNNIASSGHQNTIGGNYDAFVAKFDTLGKRLWATYYGGILGESGSGLSVDNEANIYLCGTTGSNNNIAYKGFKDTLTGADEAFIVKFDSTGKRLWASYYGGSANETAEDIACDKFGNVYFVGSTKSSTGISINGFQDTISGDYDAFIAKFDSSGNRIWASYYGGTKAENANGISTDAFGNIYFCGETSSDYNIAYNGHLNSKPSGSAGYLSKFDSTGMRLWATYYLGWSKSVAVDNNQNVYIGGVTGSNTGIAYKAYQDHLVGGNDGYLAKFNPQGTRLWSTYFGGTNVETVRKIAINSNDDVVITGETSSRDNIATIGYKSTFGGGSYDAFLSKFDSSGQLAWGTYYGGTSDDIALSICVDKADKIFITGYNPSTFLAAFADIESEFSNLNATKYCKDDTMLFTYKFTSNNFTNFDSTNTFLVYLSDTAGVFKGTYGVEIYRTTFGMLNIAASDTIKFKFHPSSSQLYSNKYRIRLRSTSPALIWDLPDNFAYMHNTPIASINAGVSPSCLSNHKFYATNSSSGTGPLSYLWDFGNGDISISSAKNIIYSGYTSAGNYSVILTVTDTFGCVKSTGQQITIANNPNPAFTINKSTSCSRDTIVFTDLSIAGTGTISQKTWNYGDGTISTNYNTKYPYSKSGTYTITLTVRNNYGCIDSTKKVVTILPKPRASYTVNKDRQCFPDNEFIFTNTSIIDAPNTMHYFWKFDNGDTSSLKNPKITYTVKQIKYKPVLIAYSDQDSICVDSFSAINLLFEHFPVANFNITTDSVQCLKDNLFGFANTSTVWNSSIAKFNWEIAGSNFTTTNLYPYYAIKSGKIKVLLKVTDPYYSCWDSISRYIDVLAGSSATSITGPSVSKGKKQETYSVPLTPGSTYVWSIIGGVIISGQGTNQIVVRWNENTGITGQLSLAEKNVNGCGDALTKAVSLSPSSLNGVDNIHGINLYPNPAANDLTIDMGSYTNSYTITIFNNLGQMVLSTEGTTENKLLQLSEFLDGVYFIQIEGDKFSYKQKLVIQKQ